MEHHSYRSSWKLVSRVQNNYTSKFHKLPKKTSSPKYKYTMSGNY